jgi:hypothetical protein
MANTNNVVSLVTTTPKRTIVRGANPFAVKANAALIPAKNSPAVYESVEFRGSRAHKNDHVKDSIKRLKARMNGKKFSQSDFGTLALVPLDQIDLNVLNQRLEDPVHQANIIDRFNPAIAMVVMCIKLKNGRYSAWEGQQTACLYYHLREAGLVDSDILVQIKYIDEDHEIPGTDLKGEAIGNYGFRQINGGGRKPIDAFHMHRSRVTAVQLYGSKFREDVQSNEIQEILKKNNMFPAPAVDARANQAQPGMVTYIHGLNSIAGHDTDDKAFDLTKTDLDWALGWHDKHYRQVKGVDGGFILAFGRLHNLVRSAKPKMSAKTLVKLGTELHELFRSKYGSPKGFHNDCKSRLENLYKANDMRYSWTDACLLPMLMLDYKDFGGTVKLPKIASLVTYENI